MRIAFAVDSIGTTCDHYLGSDMSSQYAHLPIGEPVEFISSSYWISQEDKIDYHGREILCIVRETSCITCCDGSYCSGFVSILVPGFIKKYKYKIREDGLSVSEVESIQDEKLIKEIRKIVLEKYPLAQVEFL